MAFVTELPYRVALSDGDVHKEKQTWETNYTPIYVMTTIFAIIFFIGPFAIKKGENKWIIKTCMMLASFFLWLFWVTVYIAGMNPLVGPQLRNTTLAWMAHTWV
ncbi:V-type proton ATPase subunit e isoform X2 [Bombyx mori]|uniref:V-type proton ATPase subunit n=1 Tax=Bombyx mori TaxID=7091 RepID=A0A8R2HQV8_BOMMO|nr:V-type proton ATPase subunit e isoform X2 [Bombyx mori]